MKSTLCSGGLAAIALLSACSKLPGVGKLTGGGGGGGSTASTPVPAVTPTPTVDDEAPYELRSLASRAKTLEGYAATNDDHQMRKQLPEVERALEAARAKFPDRDYAPYERLLADAAAAIAAIERNRRDRDADVKRSMQVREELEAQLRGVDPRGTPSGAEALSYLQRYQAVAERCQREQLAPLSTAIGELCRTAAGPHQFARPAADRDLAKIDGELDAMTKFKIPQAAKGEVWFDDGDDFLDVQASVAPHLATLDELAKVAGIAIDTAARRARAAELATAFAEALATAGKRDAMPKGLLTSKTITSTAENWIGDDGKVIRAGVEKSSVRSVKNDFGVVTGKSGAGVAAYQPPNTTYCFVRRFEAYAEADGSNWQLSSRGVGMLGVTRCK